MIKPSTKSILANETAVGPRFNFYNYEVGATYHNDGTIVDFITDGNDLYVCGIEEVTVTAPDIKDQPNLIKLISKGVDGQRGPQGAQGRPGHSPKITAKFDGKQMIIYADGNRIAVTNDLTGPSWKPERQGNTIVWNRTRDDEQPAAIDLNELRAEDYKPVLFRVDSDNTKRSDEESGPARFIQWKYEGEENWTNLISIAELMNLTLAGVCTWRSELDGEWHIGHREVLRAKYESTATGKKIISHVDLGEVLFDAGPILPDFELTISMLESRMDGLEEELETLRLEIPTKVSAFENDVPYLTEAKAENLYQPKGNYVEGVRVNNGSINYPASGIVNLSIETPSIDAYTKSEADERFQPKGNYLTEHQPLKTVNGNSLVGSGNIDLGQGTVKSVNNSLPDANGNVSIDIPQGTVKSVNNVLPDANGNVTISGGSDVDLSEYAKSVNNIHPDSAGNITLNLPNFDEFVKTINGNGPDASGNVNITVDPGDITLDGVVYSVNGVHPDSNGNVTISLAENPILNLKIENGKLYKKAVNDADFVEVGSVGSGDGSGCERCWSESDILELISDSLVNYLTASDINIQTFFTSANGVKIATVTIKGVSTDIYAPMGSSPVDPDQPTPSVVSYNMFMVYQRTADNVNAPATNTITSATWNLNTNELDLVSEYWLNHPYNAVGENKYLWMTYATFRSDTGTIVGNWADPVCLTSRQGEGDGADSNNREFIYRSLTAAEYPNVINVRPVKGNDSPEDPDDNLPASDSLAVRQWLDHPTGISPEYPYEICAFRRKHDGIWSEYSMPFVWSRWGEDGVDGDGVEYVFRRATEDEVDITENTITLKSNVGRPDNSWAYDSPVAPWTDEPSGVSVNYPYEFCSMRKGVPQSSSNLGTWSEPALWAKYGKDGAPGEPGDPVTILSQVRYYKASNQATGVTAPNSSLDPTLPENGSWLTSSNTIVLDATNAYLWMFERVIYSNGRIWQSDPVVIRFFNDQVEIDYDTLAAEVEERIADDLNAATQRITNAENRLDNLDDEIDGITTTTDDLTGRVTAVEARAVYDDDDIKALAEVVIDAKKASIVAEADANTDGKINVVNQTLNALDGRITSTADSLDEVSGELNTVKADLDAAEASIELAATKSELNGAISDARTEWRAGDAAITSTVYTKTETDTKLSVIQQKADKISLVVGNGKLIDENTGNVRASVVVDAINGGEVTIEANKINLLGETIATAIQAAEISADQITTGTLNANRIAANSIDASKIDATNLHVNYANVDGLLEAGQIKSSLINADEIHATVAEFEYLTVNGVPIGENKPLNIVFGVSSVPSSPEANTLYFLY